MLVSNRQRVTAIVLRRDRRGLWLVPMAAGVLHALHIEDAKFRADWHEIDYPMEKALDNFLRHARSVGATRSARAGLESLHERMSHQMELALA
jgi:hypothetical protein